MKTAHFLEYQKKVDETCRFLEKEFTTPPQIVVITGTGQGRLPADLNVHQKIPYSSIPNFPKATAPGHENQLIIGQIADQEVAVFQGRFHYYEGYSINEITLPVRVFSIIGAQILLTGNTAGGLNPEFSPGELMIVDDHLNLMGVNPLRGPNNDMWGPRFPDMSQVYSERLKKRAIAAAKRLDISVKRGVYAAVAGPSLETPAETRFLRICGADAVGMSTVPEIIVAKHAGMEVLGLSIIANINDPDNFQPIILEEVITQVERAEDKFLSLLNDILTHLQIQ